MWLALLGFVLLAACGRGVPPGAQVVVAGDSVMAWNRVSDASVADGLRDALGVAVGDVSLPSARILPVSAARSAVGLHIPSQLDGVAAPWVVLNGGANDLRDACGCTGCDAVLDRMLSEDGQSGTIAALIAAKRAAGARVLWADYYTSPRFAGTPCTGPYDILSARLARMAAGDPGVMIVDMGRVLPSNDLSLFAGDRLHPSAKGSARIAALIAERLRESDPERFGE